MTQPATIRRAFGPRPPWPDHLRTALSLAADGVPVLPLRRGKVPFANCHSCAGNACGGRPNMRTPGPCQCPGVCHAWAAATTDPDVIASPAWAAVWRRAVCVGYHPGGAHLTVVDLDNADAVTWARETLPATRTVATTRGEHWIYRGAMTSRNAVRPGVDIKSAMAYARYLGPGSGHLTDLPDTVRTLAAAKPPTTPAAMPAAVAPTGEGTCPHGTPAYLSPELMDSLGNAVDDLITVRGHVQLWGPQELEDAAFLLTTALNELRKKIELWPSVHATWDDSAMTEHRDACGELADRVTEARRSFLNAAYQTLAGAVNQDHGPQTARAGRNGTV